MSDRFTRAPMTALGRDATDTYSGSSPESRRWRFASRKPPLADESSRPVAGCGFAEKEPLKVQGEGRCVGRLFLFV